ncbi:hypothetical protein K432DRAFT_428090 [Lepidopterella palustris CBS 459.81]|uniref:Membrane anchor Opy2 N-terminal domain-containing protein n=1 Tax=Lepidopterella palustris CBS 459.81 TaxID=1314670 RepID=A0A8E2JCF7_9PEZI|nr:hypothetical protein K432DRAFT_428090 [Lepidopterella palustris CBS 459.81]
MSKTVTLSAVSTVIYNATLSTTTTAACTWLGHCLGDSCTTNEDCDNDWVCQSRICIPCCGTGTPTPSPNQEHSLSTATAIGIGVAIPACVAVIIGILYLVWRGRRRKRQQSAWEAPENSFGKVELDTTGVEISSRKHRAELGEEILPAELADSTHAVEADTIELVELEGDVGSFSQRRHDPIIEVKDLNEQAFHTEGLLAHYRSLPSAHFEEHLVSPESQSPNQSRRSPVSDLSPRLLYSPPDIYRRFEVEEDEQSMFDDHDGLESYTLFRWPTTKRGSVQGKHLG